VNLVPQGPCAVTSSASALHGWGSTKPNPVRKQPSASETIEAHPAEWAYALPESRLPLRFTRVESPFGRPIPTQPLSLFVHIPRPTQTNFQVSATGASSRAAAFSITVVNPRKGRVTGLRGKAPQWRARGTADQFPLHPAEPNSSVAGQTKRCNALTPLCDPRPT